MIEKGYTLRAQKWPSENFDRRLIPPIVMKKTGMDRDALYLPQEIISNILKRIPVKSLIRFQCVSKHWRNLIKSPSFIAEHLKHSSLQNPSLLFECKRNDCPLRWHFRLMDCATQVREVPKAPLIDSLEGASIVGSYNGLLCLEFNQYKKSPPSLLLWNPATTAVRHVPRTEIDFHLDYWVTGFGFSPIVNDYKIVRIYAESYDLISRAEVFSLSRGSWEDMSIGNLNGVKIDSVTVTANGIMFWSGIRLEEGIESIEEDWEEGGDGDAKVIVSFDIAREVFTLMQKPDFKSDTDEKLTVFENKLAILCDIWGLEDGRSDLIDLWMMEEGTCAFREGQSWTKIYACSPCADQLDAMTIWGNEMVCIADSTVDDDDEERINVLYLMNVTTDEVKRLIFPIVALLIIFTVMWKVLYQLATTRLKNIDPESTLLHVMLTLLKYLWCNGISNIYVILC